MKKFAWIFALALFVVLGCQLTAKPALARSPTLPPTEQPVATSVSFAELAPQDTLVALYQQAIPGIVSVRIRIENLGWMGSGFVYDKEGHIITNYHVVDGAPDKVEVDFHSGYKAYGTVVGSDVDADIAVIHVDAPPEELHPLPLGDSDALQIGQTVVAIGNPFGLNGTMTIGIVSALGRTAVSMRDAPDGGYFSFGDAIQTDAAINPGNSGGPLFNLDGEVVGINRSIQTTTFSEVGQPLNSGIGFAVSSNIVKRVVPVLIEKGSYDYPYLGIASVDDLTLYEIEALDLPRFTGVYITHIVKDSPADKAGLRAGEQASGIEGLLAGGDLIIGIDGQEVKEFGDLLHYLLTYTSPGDTVTLTILRDGEEQEIPLTLGKRP